MSRSATRRGDTALGCTRLIECLSLIQSETGQVGAAALDAAAELAAAASQPERAVEIYGASERVRRTQSLESPREADRRAKALERLRGELGQERFDEAWKASRHEPFPFEFYISSALHWLTGLESAPPSKTERDDTAEDKETSFTPVNPGSTAVLIAQVRGGNPTARERLAGRYLEALRGFAHGRLPGKARDLMDTDDLVQVTVLRALDKVHAVDAQRKGNFLAYMRKILVNKVRDEIRRASKTPQMEALSPTVPSNAPTPFDDLLERDSILAYHRALSRLSTRQREALILRIEHGFSYQQVADEIGSPSANAARMIISRGLASVTKHLRSR